MQSQAYRQQYGFNAIFLLPVNLKTPFEEGLCRTIEWRRDRIKAEYVSVAQRGVAAHLTVA